MGNFRKGISDGRYYFQHSLDDFGRRHPVVFEVQCQNKIVYVLSLTQQYIYYINAY